jgi:hypothetical protein
MKPSKDGKDLKIIKANTISFDPDTGIINFADKEKDGEIYLFMIRTFDKLLTQITTEELRKIVVGFLTQHCFAALNNQKGGTYYIDMKDHEHLFNLKRLLEVYLKQPLNIFPVIKAVESREYIRPKIMYQCRKYWLLNTKNIKTMLNGQSLGNRTIGKYINVIQEILEHLKYYAQRFRFSLRFIEQDADKLTMLLEQKLGENIG